MTAISITRALSEIKSLDDQIKRHTQEARFVYISKGLNDKKTVVNTAITPEEAQTSIQSKYQKITSLIARRRALKAAIQKSNASTSVTIGNEAMLVADAIERKNSISYEVNLFNAMKQQYGQAIAAVERANASLNEQIEKAVQQAYNNDKGKVSEEQYSAVANPRINEHQHALIDPLKLGELMEREVERLNAFLMEVDFVLSESNAKTTIEI